MKVYVNVHVESDAAGMFCETPEVFVTTDPVEAVERFIECNPDMRVVEADELRNKARHNPSEIKDEEFFHSDEDPTCNCYKYRTRLEVSEQ